MSPAVDVHKVFAAYFAGVEALAWAVSKTLAEGSICLDLETFKKSIANNDEFWQANPFREEARSAEEMTAEGLFVTHKEDELKPFVAHNGKVYLHRYFTYETQIIENITRLGSNFKIITGGPGTGKTYSLAKELEEIFRTTPDIQVAMAAPTGKAAARMEESIRKFTDDTRNNIEQSIKDKLNALKASTIHRLLGYIRNSVFFRHNKENPLPYDVVIIDEASMIDGAMMAKLLNAIGDNTRFYLIGDKDQLASVEAGSVFGDICRAKDSMLVKAEVKVEVEVEVKVKAEVKAEDEVEAERSEVSNAERGEISLHVGDESGKAPKAERGEISLHVEVKVKNWRAADSPRLIAFSGEIIAGNQDLVSTYENNNEVVIDTEYAETLFNEQVKLYKEYIAEENITAALQKLNRVRVLCVTREHDHSVAETNGRIEKLLRKEINDPSLFSPKAGFYHNQPIIITKNDYDLGVNNGDVGLVRRGDKGVLKAYFEAQDGKERVYAAGYLNHYETVFAMTIHKSQGSEFDHVVVLLPEKQARKLLTRELLYTAVTRAKKKVLVQSAPDSLVHCITKTVSRASGLTERIMNKS